MAFIPCQKIILVNTPITMPVYYIQEPSAMLPAQVLPIEPGDFVLDTCAAPGGKSSELANKLNGTGLLFSNDISTSRCQALLKNLERLCL